MAIRYKAWFKRIGYALAVLTILSLVATHLLFHFMTPTDADVKAEFPGYEVTYLPWSGYDIRVVAEEGPEDSVIIVWVHGAPGGFESFKKFMLDENFQAIGRQVAFDRPGYGGTQGAAITDIEKQAAIIKAIADHYHATKVIAIGHSYGGPIAGIFPALYPEMARHTVMMAPLNDPESEPIFWFSYPSWWKATRWVFPDVIKVAGVEKFTHSAALKSIEPLWSNIRTPVLNIHGEKDYLAPYNENVSFARSHIPKNHYQEHLWNDEGHLFLWTDYETTKTIILDFLKE